MITAQSGSQSSAGGRGGASERGEKNYEKCF